MAKQPLMCSSSELADGSEPHDHICCRYVAGVDMPGVPGVDGEGCTRGGLGGCLGGCIPGTQPAGPQYGPQEQPQDQPQDQPQSPAHWS